MATGTAPTVSPKGTRRVPRTLHAALSCGLALLYAAATVGPAAADNVPTPLPSAGSTTPPALRLPVIPTKIDPYQPVCTKPSPTVMTAVPWAQQSLGLSRAQQLSTGTGVTVAVIDTGVSRTAPALAGRVTAAGAAGNDCVGHGTFIAGLIAAAPTAGSGFSGVAPGARILAIPGMAADGSPSEAVVAAGIRAAADAGAKVIDVSLGFQNTSPSLQSALAYAAKRDVLVVAAGVPDDVKVTGVSPDGGPPQVPFWPAAHAGVLSVVDVDILGNRPDGAVDPARADLAAPGDGITGIGPTGKGHFLGNGPSAAAAFTAGAAALLRSYRPDLTAPEIAARLTSTAYPAPVPRLDPYAALSTVLPAPTPLTSLPTRTITLTSTPTDPAPTHRAYLILAASTLAALVLGAAAILHRKRRASAQARA
jgi:hypothetical protein